MGALKKIDPNETERSALLEYFASHRRGGPPNLASLIKEIVENRGPTFFFGGTAEFSSQEAADLLGVSRPFLVSLLDQGKIKFSYVGKHRRVNAASLLLYKKEQDARNKKIMDELTAIAQEHDL